MTVIVVDLETTGLNPKLDQIIEIGAVRLTDSGEISDTYQQLVRPGVPLSPHITAITHITDLMLADAPLLEEVLPEFLEFCQGATYLIGHNSSFDRGFLEQYLPFSDWLDTLDLARIAWPQLRRHSLGYLTQELHIDHPNAHRALADCLATAELFIQAQQQLLALPAKVWQNILAICSKVDSPLSVFILDLGKDIIKNAFVTPVGEALTLPALDNRDIQPRERQENWQYQLDTEEIVHWFGPDGLLARKFPNYEAREQQQQLTEKVCEAFNEQKILVAEAATGTGKSLAYLLPALRFAQGAGLPVAVSTYTINLQQQLWNKDIPFLKELLGEDFSVALVKGRSNYLCRRKWREAAAAATPKNLAFLLRIAVWLEETETADSAELHLSAPDFREFQQLAAHAETCNSPWCNHKGSCYIQRMRRLAANADLLVINHSLLLSNSLWGGGSLLPQLSHVIVDEAHHLEQVAEGQMTLTLSAAAITQVISRVERKDGVFSLLKGTLHDQQHQKLKDLALELKETFLQLKEAAGEFFGVSRSLLAKGKGFREQWRLTNGRQQPYWEGVEGALSNLIFLLEQGRKQLLTLHDTAEDFGEAWMDTPWLNELPYAASGFAELSRAGQLIVDGDLEEYAIWLSGGDREACFWQVAPLSVRQTLAELVYDDKASLVFTSATLESKGSFDFFCHGAGLDMAALPVETLRLSHTFDYTSQAKLFLPQDVPDFTQVTELEACHAIAQSLIPMVKAAQGRTLVLFTSLAQLREVHSLMEATLAQENITVLAQGIDGSREALLYRLQQEERVCLLGASSFWEGVDVAGEALSLVVLVRLPFQPVFEPYTAAKLEKVAKEGRDPFREYSLPQAILRFKQGFGRLIRTKTDRGAFCVLDRRLWEKQYGRHFLQALPAMEKETGTSQEIAWLIHDWLDPV